MSNTISTVTCLGACFIALLLTSAGCAERLADCVEVYPNTGATRRPGYTRAACEERCASIQGALDCYWDGRLGTITEPSVVVPRQVSDAD